MELSSSKEYFCLQETILLEPMFEIPGSDINSVRVTEDVVKDLCKPIYVHGKITEPEDEDPTVVDQRAVNP